MKLSAFIKTLQKLEAEGHGDLQVFTVEGASGCVSEVGNPSINDEVGVSGPFDLEDGEKYVSIYVGN
ncbi:hypothetical protein M0R04_04685 [Candidatus Dojkabacteria bacterium]|jgi:hypothetical protein|nr:hypothetical protein [Candidatus Dojkabacteria bacterium]